MYNLDDINLGGKVMCTPTVSAPWDSEPIPQEEPTQTDEQFYGSDEENDLMSFCNMYGGAAGGYDLMISSKVASGCTRQKVSKTVSEIVELVHKDMGVRDKSRRKRKKRKKKKKKKTETQAEEVSMD